MTQLMRTFVLTAVLLLLPTFAQAQFQYGKRYNSEALPQGSFLRYPVEANSSYCCEIDNVPPYPADFRFSGVVLLDPISNAATIRDASNDEPKVLSRFCFLTPDSSDLAYARIQITYSPSPSPPSTDQISFVCRETTLFGGYNTSVTDFNFLELSNTMTPSGVNTNRDVTAKVFAVNTVPNPDLTVINGAEVSVPVGSRTDVNIHQAAGPGAFGPLRVIHNGAPGSIKAVLTQYNITSNAPLDFTPVAQEVFATRTTIAGGAGWE